MTNLGKNWELTYGYNETSLRYAVTARIKETNAFEDLKSNLIHEPSITLGYDADWVYKLEVSEADEGLNICNQVGLNMYKVYNGHFEHCFTTILEMDSEAHLIEQVIAKIKELRKFKREFRGQEIAYRV